MAKKETPSTKAEGVGAGNVTRTRDLLITNQLLYQLSHSSVRKKVYTFFSYLTFGN